MPTESADCDDHCIKMTKRTEAEIETIIGKIGDFINSLIETHHKFDIKRAKFELEAHLPSEEEKEVILEIAINDCVDFDGKEEEEVSEKTKTIDQTKTQIQSEQQKSKKKQSEKLLEIIETNKQNDIKTQSEKVPYKEPKEIRFEQLELIERSEKQDGVVRKPKKPELIMLDFDDVGLGLLKKLDKHRGKKPLVVYIQQRGDQIVHTFMNR